MNKEQVLEILKKSGYTTPYAVFGNLPFVDPGMSPEALERFKKLTPAGHSQLAQKKVAAITEYFDELVKEGKVEKTRKGYRYIG